MVVTRHREINKLELNNDLFWNFCAIYIINILVLPVKVVNWFSKLVLEEILFFLKTASF